jgi:hypothetical protein
MKESSIQHETRLKLGTEPDCVFYRNNVGQAEFVSPNGQVSRVQYGLCVGSSDLISLVSVTITPEMVGKVIGRFTALELKVEGGRTERDREEKQRMFRNLVNRYGGYSQVITDSQQVTEALARARRVFL